MMAVELQSEESSYLALERAGVIATIPKLMKIAEALFCSNPTFVLQTDHESPDDHYLLVQVTFAGSVERARERQEKWYNEIANLLGESASFVRLLLSVA